MPAFRVDRYMGKSFCPKTYNCWHFVRDVWADLTGLDLGDQTPDTKSPEIYTEKAIKVANTMIRLENPVSPCLVLMQRNKVEPHVGIFYNGKVLHLSTNGVNYLPLDQATARFPQVSFYADSRLSQKSTR